MQRFDVSWKFILLIIIIFMFLLNIIDTVVHGQTVDRSAAIDHQIEFQTTQNYEW